MTCLEVLVHHLYDHVYLPWYSRTYNFQGVEYLQMRFRGPVAVTSPLTDHAHRRLHSMYHDSKRDPTRTISSVGSDGKTRADLFARDRQEEISAVTRPDRQNCTTKNRHFASAPVSPHWYAPCLRRPIAEKLEKARTKDELT
jgi:hypothetical protein